MQVALIHNFDGSSHDEDGEVLLGFYYQILDSYERPLHGIMGPYPTKGEAELACQLAWETNDY